MLVAGIVIVDAGTGRRSGGGSPRLSLPQRMLGRLPVCPKTAEAVFRGLEAPAVLGEEIENFLEQKLAELCSQPTHRPHLLIALLLFNK